MSQPRITQLTNLTLLAPDIQETLLFLPRVVEGNDPVTEKELRVVVAEVEWGRQRNVWRATSLWARVSGTLICETGTCVAIRG